MYAIIESGGKQFKVSQGDVIKVEKLSGSVGQDYVFESVLGIFDGESVMFGKPFVKGASVTGNIVAQGKEKKVIVYKYKSKKGFHKKKGHRQPFTQVRIDKVTF